MPNTCPLLTVSNCHIAECGKPPEIDRLAPTTQLCSNCGQQYDLALRDRILTCDCGLTLDRDTYGQRSYHNAAINIKHAGASTDYLSGRKTRVRLRSRVDDRSLRF